RHARLESERVAGCETSRHEAVCLTCGVHGVPESDGGLCADQKFKSILARVAGAGDEERATVEASVCPGIVLLLAPRDTELGDALDGGDDHLGGGTLDGEQCVGVGDVLDAD